MADEPMLPEGYDEIGVGPSSSASIVPLNRGALADMLGALDEEEWVDGCKGGGWTRCGEVIVATRVARRLRFQVVACWLVAPPWLVAVAMHMQI